MQRCLVGALAFVAAASIAAPVLAQDALPSSMKYRLSKVVKSLDQAEAYVEQGKESWAKGALKAARRDLKTAEDMYKGKFNTKDPYYTTIIERVAALEKKLGAAAPKPKEEPKPEAPAAKKFYPQAKYRVDKANAALDGFDQSMKFKKPKQARSSLDSAAGEIEKIEEYYAGRFDPKHPVWTALMTRFEKAAEALDALEGKASGMVKTLKPLLAAMQAENGRLNDCRKKMNYAVLGDMDPKKMAEARALNARVRQILPGALETAKEFRKQFPNEDDVKKLVGDEGYTALFAVQQTEGFPGEWGKLTGRASEEWLREAENTFASFDSFIATAKKSGNKAVVDYHASNIEKQVDEAEAHMGLVETFYASDEGASKEQKALLKRAQTILARGAEYRKAAAKLQNKAIADAAARLKNARVPKTAFTEPKWTAVSKTIAAIYAKKHPKDQLKRVVISSDWDERTEARWRNKSWVIGTYRYINAYCVAKNPSGKFRVYSMSFRRTRQSDGSFGALAAFGVGDVWEILEENIDK